MKILGRKLIYVVSFVGLFLIFLIITFPFGLLKEALIVPLSEAIGQPISIERISVGIPPKINVYAITLPQADTDLKIHKVQVGIKISRLLFAQLHVWLKVFHHQESRRTQSGIFELHSQFQLTDLNTPTPLPRHIQVKASHFPLTDILDYSIHTYTNSPSANLLVAPLLKQLSFKGFLQSDVDLHLESKDVSTLNGHVKLSLQKFRFESTDPNLMIPEQSFETAQIRSTIANGQIKIDPNSLIKADDIVVGAKGIIDLKNQIRSSNLDLNVDLEMSGSILNQLGVLVQMALLRGQGEWNGRANITIEGPLMAPQLRTQSDN